MNSSQNSAPEHPEAGSGIQLREFQYPDDYPEALGLWENAGPGIHVRRSDEPEEIQKKLQRDPDLFLVAETRGLYTNAEGGVRWGVHFYGSKGYLSIDPNGGFQYFLGRSDKPEPDAGAFDEIDHFGNFFDAVRAGKREMLMADIEETFLSNSLCHLGNVSYRVGRQLQFDPTTERFVGDAEANQYLTRKYRAPFVL